MWQAASDVVLRRKSVVLLAVLLAAGAAVPLETPFPLLGLVPLYGIAAFRDWRAAVLAVVAVAATVCLHAVLYGPTKAGSVLAVTVSMTALATIVAAAGVASGERRRARERESALLAEQAVAQERLRIARELHDAVGHDVSLMIVQAQALGATAGDEAVRAATDAIADLGRHTMREMSRTLALLRNDAAEHHPQPGLAVLDEVLEGARRAGVSVTMSTEGAPRPLASALDASAYRIVQEAVTNVVRHAGGAPATVTLRFGASALELLIVDDGPGSRVPAAPGHGLIGMRERAALFGGTLHAGPRDGDGFEVRALLPYPPDGSPGPR
jgi:signal transduction histidine kinase